MSTEDDQFENELLVMFEWFSSTETTLFDQKTSESDKINVQRYEYGNSKCADEPIPVYVFLHTYFHADPYYTCSTMALGIEIFRKESSFL